MVRPHLYEERCGPTATSEKDPVPGAVEREKKGGKRGQTAKKEERNT